MKIAKILPAGEYLRRVCKVNNRIENFRLLTLTDGFIVSNFAVTLQLTGSHYCCEIFTKKPMLMQVFYSQLFFMGLFCFCLMGCWLDKAKRLAICVKYRKKIDCPPFFGVLMSLHYWKPSLQTGMQLRIADDSL